MVMLEGCGGDVPFALYCLISGCGWESGVLLGTSFFYASVLSGAGLVQVACVFVCLMVGEI